MPAAPSVTQLLLLLLLPTTLQGPSSIMLCSAAVVNPDSAGQVNKPSSVMLFAQLLSSWKPSLKVWQR